MGVAWVFGGGVGCYWGIVAAAGVLFGCWIGVFWVWVLFESCLLVPREDVGGYCWGVVVLLCAVWFCWCPAGCSVGHIWVLLGAVCVLLVMLGGVWMLLGGVQVVGVL